MDDSKNDPVLARLDRLSELLIRRIDRLEQRVRGLEQDNGEIINLLIAVKAGLEEASGDLLAQLDEFQGTADDAPPPDDDGFEDPTRGGQPGPMLH